MRRGAWIFSLLSWDAGLPLVVAACCFVLPEVVAFLLVPPVSALIRASLAMRQLENRGIRATFGRQFFMGCALIVLMVFDCYLVLLHHAPAIAWYGWLIVGTVYLVYLGLVAIALRPMRVEAG